jgi:DNA polymerase-4
MDVCVENVFPAVAAPFNSFHDDAREGKGRESGVSPAKAIPNIVHVVIDEFFASVEQVLNPEFRGKPVLVGRGVVASASYEAKMCGVKTAMTIREALRICPSAIVVPGHYVDYADFAERVRRILEPHAPAVEAGALDDFYLDFAATKQSYSAYEAILRRVQAEVLEQTGLTVSIGAARTKAVAAMASQREQPRGFQMVAPGAEADFLAPLPVDALYGIIPVHAGSLAARGIATLGELRKVPRAALEGAFGEATGRQIWERARGIDGRGDRRASTTRPASVSRETTMESGTMDRELLCGLLEYLCERIGSSLTESGRQTQTMGLRIRYVDGFTARQTVRLVRPSSDKRVFLARAKELFGQLFTRRVAVRTLGASATNLEADSQRDALEDRDFAQTTARPFEAPFLPQGKQGEHAMPLQRSAS